MSSHGQWAPKPAALMQALPLSGPGDRGSHVRHAGAPDGLTPLLDSREATLGLSRWEPSKGQEERTAVLEDRTQRRPRASDRLQCDFRKREHLVLTTGWRY